jgi:TonB family protein
MTERIFSNGYGGWEQRITHWLIHRAARAAPGSLSDRFEEEWLADLAARSGALSRLRFAIGCCWATRVIAYEHEPSRGPVVSPVVADKTLAAYTDQNFGFLSLRSSTFCLVAMLHALLLYGFMTALSHTHGTATPDPLQYRDLKTPIRRELPLRLPTPHLKDMNIEVPIPDTHIRYEPDPDEGVTTEILKEPSQTSPPQPSPPHVITQVQGGPGAGFPNPDEYYPERSRLLDEQGIATVQVCVDAKGRLTSEPATLQSAGSLRLDEGALRLAKAGSGHYRPSLEDGQPVKSCYPLRIRFQLRH